MKEFDPINIPLTGVHIIEASAGTGKTYAISNIFLRLILEKGIPVENILIVSFTEAATNELRYRIRNRLQEAINAFSYETEDIFLKEMLNRLEDKHTGKELLRRAIKNLDDLIISTIHGFCRRIIKDNTFESGSLLNSRLIVNQQLIKEEIIYDFWRRYLYNESPLFIDYLKKNGFNPENVSSLIDLYLVRPYIRVIPEVNPSISEKYEAEYRELINKIFSEWESSKHDIWDFFINSKAINRRVYSKKNIMIWLEYIDQFINAKGYEFGSSELIKRFSRTYLSRYIKKGYICPKYPFFELMERLLLLHESLEEIYRKKMLFMKRTLISYMEDELQKRKLSKNLIGFDDLIRMVYRGISEGTLTDALRDRFFAGMIDEFQDTDPVQYEIFKKIFYTDKHALYLIGDPKQSIYSFRGADIFTYIKAARDIKSKFTLKENWRSYSPLIEAINRIFGSSKSPFLYKEIKFIPSKPAQNLDAKPLYLDGIPEPCMKIWVFDYDSNKGELKERISNAVANEISRLLYLSREDRLKIGDKKLRASDIAVLVRRNQEAGLIQKKLSSLHIPTVIYSTSNIFDSWQYRELQRILYAIYNYKHSSYIKAALGTDMLGLKGEDIWNMSETEWERYVQKFRQYHELWNRFGFMTMFREFLNKEEVMPRLMKFQDGERRCTNILHLIEVIHEAEKEYMLGMDGLIKWLSAQKDEQVSAMEEYQLRLESDESAVKIITIHRSKGLEFPVVFVPFSWEGLHRRSSSNMPVIFHDPENSSDYVLDIGSEKYQENMEIEKKESLAEDIRLLYVALTRAKNCCYLVCGKNKETNTSAFSYLFSDSELKSIFHGMEDEVLISPIPESAKGYVNLEQREEKLTLKSFSGHIDTSWHICSFSSLVSNRLHIEDAQDMDRVIEEETDEEEEILKEPSLDIFSFPKGARAGTFFHDIMEHLDFTEKDDFKIKELVSSKLRQYGFEEIWTDVVFKMIKDLLSASIDPEEGLFLSDVPMKNRINEMEFYFPLKKIEPQMIEELLKAHGIINEEDGLAYQIGRLRFDPVEGFMKGFIDMIFYWKEKFFLIDWKSNLLGKSPDAYCMESLSYVMKKEFYMLQLLIYTLALDQYLRINLSGYTYEKCFGKAYYVFLRGINPDRPYSGIYRYRPSSELISHLREIFIG